MDEHRCFQKDRIGVLEKDAKTLTEFKGSTESDIKTIFITLNDIKDNHLVHLNQKLNWLLFSVLGSVFVVVLVSAIKWFLKI